jgi:hypothetical protein
MWNWPALILSPSLALANLCIAYALVTPSCARQTGAPLHWVTGVCLALSLLFTMMAWRNRHRLADAPQSDAAMQRPHFLASVAAMTGLLSSLVIVAIWLPQWMLSPCYS